MTIFLDPTETREHTRLPQTVIDSAQALPGLESQTGADLLISTLRMPPLMCVDDSDFSQANLRKHCHFGMLVQRKSGRDLTSSIAKLPDILHRMQQWTPLSWLIVIADMKVDKDGQVILDGQESGYTYASVEGALSYWQLRGGYYSILSRDSLLPQWINGWIDRLEKIQEDRTYYVHRPLQQALVTVPRWYETLATFPNIGQDRARLIAETCGSLWSSIEYLSNELESVHIDGIGKETFRQARKHLGYPAETVGLKLSVLEKNGDKAE